MKSLPSNLGKSLVLLCLLAITACKGAGEAALDAAVEQTPGLTIKFEGASSFKRKELLKVISPDLLELSSDGLGRPDVDDLAYALEVYYRRQGFPDAFVSYALDQPKSAEPELEREDSGEQSGKLAKQVRFLIEEGRRVHVSKFQIRGLTGSEVTDKDRLRIFFSPPSGFFKDDTWWYVSSELQQGSGALGEYLLSKGYLSSQVSSPDVQWEDADKTRAAITINVEQGPLWVLEVAELTIEGELGQKLRLQLEAVLDRGRRDSEGQLKPYSPRLAYGIRAQLLEACGQWGRLDATCELKEVELEEGRMRVQFHLTPGPVVRVANIVTSGNKKSRTAFLQSRLTLKPGDVVDTRELRRSFGRLFATGLYATVSLEPLVADDEDENAQVVERDLALEVLELTSIEFTVEPGYGSYEGPRLRVGLEDSNLLGTGRTGEISATLGVLAQKVSLGLGDRALFDSDYRGSSAIYYDLREEPSYTLREQGIALSVSRLWSPASLEGSLGLRFRRTDVEDVEVTDDSVLEALSEIDISSVALTVARDTRDQFFTPTAGSFLRAQLEWASSALGSDVDFLLGRIEGARFLTLPWEGGVLGASFETSLIAPLADTTVIPLQVRLFNGGENTVRSFAEDELGNLDSSGEPIGGEANTVLSLELRQHLVGALSSAVFYDVGNLEPDHEQYLDFDDMRQAIGFGLRYALPIGPIRIDAAWNPNASGDEDRWVVHLAVGLSF